MSPQRLLCIVPHCSVSPSEVSIDRPSLTAQMLPLPPRWQTTSFRSVLPIRSCVHSVRYSIDAPWKPLRRMSYLRETSMGME